MKAQKRRVMEPIRGNSRKRSKAVWANRDSASWSGPARPTAVERMWLRAAGAGQAHGEVVAVKGSTLWGRGRTPTGTSGLGNKNTLLGNDRKKFSSS